MRIPTKKGLIDQFKRGSCYVATIPVPEDVSLEVGDRVVFEEAMFDSYDEPTAVAQGDSYVVVLTQARDTSLKDRGKSLYEIEWKS